MVGTTGPASPITALADNRRLVLSVLRGGEATRAEIAAASGLSPAATARITASLENERLIARTEQLPSSGGRPAWRYRFTAEGRFLGGLRVRAGVCQGLLTTWDGVALHNESVHAAGVGPEPLLAATLDCARRIVDVGWGHGRAPLALGVAVPAVTGVDGRLGDGPEVEWCGLPLQERLAEQTSVPVVVENDANALAASELHDGPGGRAVSLAAVILGQGLGAGLVAHGELLRGTHGTAGEIGYLLASPEVFRRPPGPIGDLEARIQAAALATEDASAPTMLWAFLAARTDEGDARAAAILDHLALALAALVAVFDPERLVIGDVPAAYADRLIAELSKRLSGRLLYDPVMTVARLGAEAVAIGAALLAARSVDLQAT